MLFGVRVFARPMRYCSLARQALSRLSLSLSSGRSWMVCAGLQKCSATPDLSSFLLIMSRRCSLNLSLSCLLVCPMYLQFLFPFCRQRFHCNAVAVQSFFYVVVFVSVRKIKCCSPVCDMLAC